MNRSVVATLAALSGLGFAALESALGLPQPPQAQPDEFDLAAFRVCITFFGATYVTGRILYYVTNSRAEADELRSWSGWHMILLNGAGAVMLLGASLLQAGIPGLFRWSTIIALVLLAVSVIDLLVKPTQPTTFGK